MSDFESETGLAKGESPRFDGFRAALSPHFEKIDQIGVKVLIWGPGEHTTYYNKRRVIKEHLSVRKASDEVATSEELVRHIEHPSTTDKVQLELLQADAADVIIGLVTSDPRQEGIYMEVQALLAYDSLVNKTFLIVPDKRDWKRARSFIQEPLLKSFPSHRTKAFRAKALKRCTDVRQFCEQKVDEARGRKIRKYIDQVLRGEV